jgi:hypothetical protein
MVNETQLGVHTAQPAWQQPVAIVLVSESWQRMPEEVD